MAWYGSSRRRVRQASEAALWFNKHSGAVTPIAWVCVLGDARQRRDDAYFYSSDPAMPATRIIELYAMRWNIEVTFEEARALLGLETTRHWCRQSVRRVTPILFGLFTAVALMWTRLPQAKRQRRASQTPCYAKAAPTFADALFAVRRELWETSLLAHRHGSRCLTRLDESVRETILWHLAAAA